MRAQKKSILNQMCRAFFQFPLVLGFFSNAVNFGRRQNNGPGNLFNNKRAAGERQRT